MFASAKDRGKTMRTDSSTRTVFLLVTILVTGGGHPGYAEPIPSQDRDDIVRLRVARGGTAQEVAGLLEQAGKAADRGLPAELLANKIKEGLAKGVDPTRIEPVLGRLIGHLDAAQEIVKGSGSRDVAEVSGAARTRALDVLAEAFARGLTPDEARELERQARQGTPRLTAESLAAGAKGLAVLKEAGIAVKEGVPLMSVAIQRGFRSADLVDLSRELKRRSSEIQSGKVRLKSLREAIARGDRPEQLFGDERGDRGGRSGGSSGGHGGGEERIERRGDQGHGDQIRSDESRGGRPDSRPERQDRSRGGR